MKKILLLGICLFFGGALARDAFFVSDIPAQAEASSAVRAREKALIQGQQAAFKNLLHTLNVENSRIQELPDLTEAELLTLVQNVSVKDERTTGTRYIATLSVQFFPDKTREWLEKYSVTALTKLPPKTVILPVLTSGDNVLMLEENSPLFQALQRDSYTTLYPLVLPFGDAEDIARVNKETLFSGNLDLFTYFLSKYNAEQVLILQVKQDGDYYAAKTRVYPKDTGISGVSVLVKGNNSPKVWDTLLVQVFRKLDTAWRDAKTLQQGESKELIVRIPISSLQAWAKTREMLEKTTQLDKVQIQGLKKEEATVKLNFQLSYQALSDALRSKGLYLRQEENGDWILDVDEQRLEDIKSQTTPTNLLYPIGKKEGEE